MKTNRNDLLLMLAIVIVAAVSYAMFTASMKEGTYAVITVDGKEYAVLELNEDKTVDIVTANGGKNTVLVSDGHICMKEADCPDRICSNQKPISKTGETIACVPNNIIIEIKSQEDSEVDAIAR